LSAVLHLIAKPNASYVRYYSVFLRKGGFVGEQNRIDAENTRLDIVESRQRAYEHRMIYLTIILAASGFVAAVYYAVELWKTLHSCS